MISQFVASFYCPVLEDFTEEMVQRKIGKMLRKFKLMHSLDTQIKNMSRSDQLKLSLGLA